MSPYSPAGKHLAWAQVLTPHRQTAPHACTLGPTMRTQPAAPPQHTAPQPPHPRQPPHHHPPAASPPSAVHPASQPPSFLTPVSPSCPLPHTFPWMHPHHLRPALPLLLPSNATALAAAAPPPNPHCRRQALPPAVPPGSPRPLAHRPLSFPCPAALLAPHPACTLPRRNR